MLYSTEKKLGERPLTVIDLKVRYLQQFLIISYIARAQLLLQQNRKKTEQKGFQSVFLKSDKGVMNINRN